MVEEEEEEFGGFDWAVPGQAPMEVDKVVQKEESKEKEFQRNKSCKRRIRRLKLAAAKKREASQLAPPKPQKVAKVNTPKASTVSHLTWSEGTLF